MIALDRHRIRRLVFRQPVPWEEGFAVIDRVLASVDRPPIALCSVGLRSPAPHSFGGFGSFNDDYREALMARGVLLAGASATTADNPVARTNVAPALAPPSTTELFAFSFTTSGTDTDAEASTGGPSFIVSGAGDLRNQADLRPEAIVGGGTPWADSGPERASVVLGELEDRLRGLGCSWQDTDVVDVYAAEAVDDVLSSVVLPRLGPAAGRGVHRYHAHPPIAGLLFEMDCRGGTVDLMLG